MRINKNFNWFCLYAIGVIICLVVLYYTSNIFTSDILLLIRVMMLFSFGMMWICLYRMVNNNVGCDEYKHRSKTYMNENGDVVIRSLLGKEIVIIKSNKDGRDGVFYD